MAINQERFVKAKRFTADFTLDDAADQVKLKASALASTLGGDATALGALGTALGGNATAMAEIGDGLAGNTAAVAAIAAALPPETVTTMVETPGSKTWSYINEGPTTKVMGNAQIISAAVGNALAVDADGGLVVQIPAQLPDDQVFSGDNSGTVNVTLTPDTTTTPGQTNYLLKADLKVAATNPDGSANALQNTGNGFFVGMATTATPGIIEEATGEETRLGATDANKDDRAVTPGSMSYALQTGANYPIHLVNSTSATPVSKFTLTNVPGNEDAYASLASLESGSYASGSAAFHGVVRPTAQSISNNSYPLAGVRGTNQAVGTGRVAGGLFESFTNNGVNSYGSYSSASGAGSGTNIGVYGIASGGATNWAGFFEGNTKVTGKLQIAASNYADNAAALAAGLVVGDVYHTAGTLKIVI